MPSGYYVSLTQDLQSDCLRTKQTEISNPSLSKASLITLYSVNSLFSTFLSCRKSITWSVAPESREIFENTESRIKCHLSKFELKNQLLNC